MVKCYIITGPESSGSTFIAQVIAYYLGATKNINDWNGHQHLNSLKPDIQVHHISQPHGRKGIKYDTLKKMKERFKGMDLYFILTTRYIGFINLSKNKRRTNRL